MNFDQVKHKFFRMVFSETSARIFLLVLAYYAMIWTTNFMGVFVYGIDDLWPKLWPKFIDYFFGNNL